MSLDKPPGEPISPSEPEGPFVLFGDVQIAELWRYPVKSLHGERLDAVAVTADGLEGDRQFAIYDVESGLGLTGRRVP